jgi:hypothetical protein
MGTDLVLYSVPGDTKVSFMRIKTTNSSLVPDYTSNAKSLPYALRNRQNNSVYQIKAITGGTFQFATVNDAMCQSGILIRGGSSFTVTFGTNQLPPHTLSPNTRKCFLITNTCLSEITFNLRLIPQVDFVYVHSGHRKVANFTGRGSYKLIKNGTHPLFVLISLPSRVLSTREVNITVNADPLCNDSENDRSVYLGPREILSPVNESDLDEDVPITIETFRETGHLIALPIITVCLIIALSISCYRYKWIAALTEKMTQSETQSTAPNSSNRGNSQRAPMLPQDKVPF